MSLTTRVPDPRPEVAGPPVRLRPSGRSTWLTRGILFVILILQAVISLRVHNSAFEDEALYLYAGKLEIAHWFHGAAGNFSFASYFSGAPVLYPVLAGFLDNTGGLALARALSLGEMLAVTGLLYSLTRQLFSERAALCAAAIFAGTEPVVFLGNFATFDASSLFLLALAAWILVRAARWRGPAYLLAAPVAALAVAVKYAGLLFIPTLIMLAALAAAPYRGRWALLRPVLLCVAIAGLLWEALRAAGPAYLKAVQGTTTSRAHGSTAPWTLVHDTLLWGGIPIALAAIGVIAFARGAHTEPGERSAPAGGWFRRTLLALTLAGTALLAPLYQLHLHTSVSFHKHIGFGLFFAAPMAGLGLARIIGDHLRRPAIAIAIWAASLTLGMVQAGQLDNSWPEAAPLVSALRAQARPAAHYLVEADEVPIYYLLGDPDARPQQFTSTYTITYTDRRGRTLTGTAGFLAALHDQYFRVIVFDYSVSPSLDRVLAAALQASPHYHLAAVVPERDPAGHALYDANGRAFWYVWVRDAGAGQGTGGLLPARGLRR